MELESTVGSGGSILLERRLLPPGGTGQLLSFGRSAGGGTLSKQRTSSSAAAGVRGRLKGCGTGQQQPSFHLTWIYFPAVSVP